MNEDAGAAVATRPARAGGAHAQPGQHAGPARPRTVVPKRSARPGPEPRRQLARITRIDVIRMLAAGVAGVATTVVLFTQIAPFHGAVGFTVIAYLFFLGYFVLLSSFDSSGVVIQDRVASVVIHSIALLLLTGLVVVIVFTLIRGFPAYSHFNFWTTDLSEAGPLDPLTKGGMLHAAAGTLIFITLSLAVSIPLGLLCAVYLSEFPGRLSRIVRVVVEAMTALPSILCGLFIFATYVLMFGFERSGFAASLAITIMIMPIIIRSADTVLRLVPASLKEASYALGSSRWRTVWNVTLPTARSGLVNAIILGTARGIGETSPILVATGYTTYMNLDPFHGPMVSLAFATFTLVKSPEPNQIARGFGAAAVLMVLVFILFMLARVVGGPGAGQLTPRGLRRARAGSRRDALRFEARAAGLLEPQTTAGDANSGRYGA